MKFRRRIFHRGSRRRAACASELWCAGLTGRSLYEIGNMACATNDAVGFHAHQSGITARRPAGNLPMAYSTPLARARSPPPSSRSRPACLGRSLCTGGAATSGSISAAPMKPTGQPMIAAGRGQPDSQAYSEGNSGRRIADRRQPRQMRAPQLSAVAELVFAIRPLYRHTRIAQGDHPRLRRRLRVIPADHTSDRPARCPRYAPYGHVRRNASNFSSPTPFPPDHAARRRFLPRGEPFKVGSPRRMVAKDRR
jgi:hypothetical protein